jgi:hypothetical protein
MSIQQFGYGIIVESDAMNSVVYVDGKAVKKFKGETAWMKAERYASDLMFKAMYK